MKRTRREFLAAAAGTTIGLAFPQLSSARARAAGVATFVTEPSLQVPTLSILERSDFFTDHGCIIWNAIFQNKGRNTGLIKSLGYFRSFVTHCEIGIATARTNNHGGSRRLFFRSQKNGQGRS